MPTPIFRPLARAPDSLDSTSVAGMAVGAEDKWVLIAGGN